MRAIAICARALRDRKGGTAIEYGLIAALIVVAIIASVAELARTTTGIWNNVADRVVEVSR